MDPLSLAALSAAGLTQGIGFLYGQVGELLRRRRDRRERLGAAGDGGSPTEIPPVGESGQVLVGQLESGPVDEQALERYADQLARLRGLLTPYVEGFASVEPGNGQLLAQVEALRSLLEQIYRQHITFQGEQRPTTGTPVRVQTGDVGQYATQVIASGERAVATAGDISGTVISGDHNAVDRPPSQ